MNEVWLTTTYLGPVGYYRLLSESETAYIEAFEHYEKQSWRNRCRILSANGPIDLNIPVVKGSSPGQPVREVMIDYRQNWQKIHFRSIESAYRHSPFYEFLIDELLFLWETRIDLLFDYNMAAMMAILKIIKTEVTVRLTGDYQKAGYYGSADYRYAIHPKAKKQGTGTNPVPYQPYQYYHQVFSDRFGFIQDLSIIDWLFNNLSPGRRI